VEGAEHRGVRKQPPEQVLTQARLLDVGTTHGTAGEHQGDLDQDLAPVVQREPLTAPRDCCRERLTNAHSVGKCPNGVQSNVDHHTCAAGFH